MGLAEYKVSSNHYKVIHEASLIQVTCALLMLLLPEQKTLGDANCCHMEFAVFLNKTFF